MPQVSSFVHWKALRLTCVGHTDKPCKNGRTKKKPRDRRGVQIHGEDVFLRGMSPAAHVWCSLGNCRPAINIIQQRLPSACGGRVNSLPQDVCQRLPSHIAKVLWTLVLLSNACHIYEGTDHERISVQTLQFDCSFGNSWCVVATD